MANRTYRIEHTCGHKERHDLEGGVAELRDEVYLLTTTACSACHETPPQASPASELLANDAAARHQSAQVAVSETVRCTRCSRRVLRKVAMSGTLCPDCWHDENDGEGFGN